MSPLFHFQRRAIARAVAGLLPAGREVRLRAHLAGCDACRAEYDRLSLAAEALAEAAGRADQAGATGAARERARLLAALNGDGGGVSTAAAPSAPARTRWIPATLLAAPVIAAGVALILLGRPAAPPRLDSEGGVAWRGATDDGARAAPAPALLVYASRKEGGAAGAHGPVRIAAELPASGEGKVSTADYVQFGVRGLPGPSFVTVVGVDDAGQLHTYVPRPGAPPPMVAPAAQAVALGPSIDLGRGHRPGRLRIYALLSTAPLPEERVRGAAARLDRGRPGAPPLDLPVAQVAGLLTIEP